MFLGIDYVLVMSLVGGGAKSVKTALVAVSLP